ncbi:MAG: PilW family protein [Burkholderiaceae bacterium]|nr:PilW family protein [Burkholderiaceae bacterium]
MNRTGQKGVTLVELMVALVIGSLAVLVIQQVMAVFEGQKRTSSGGSDAQVNGAVALFSIEREIRQAGYGLFGGNGPLCPLGINIYFNGTTVSDGGTLRPVVVMDGGAGPDAIEFLRSDTDFAAIPTSIVKNMPNASSEVTTDSNAGLAQNQVFLVAGKDAGKVCTLMQMSQDPQKTGNGWNLQHNSGQFAYNPSNPGNAFKTAPAYEIGDAVVNMGNLVHGRYQVLCDRLTQVDPTTAAAPYTCANATPLVDEIVDLQAQYGIAPAGSVQISQWCDATAASTCGDWSNPGAADLSRIRAVRIAVVARSVQYEKEQVSPATLALWEAGDPGDPPPSRALTDDERHYRYKVFTTIVPIRNVIWGG